MAADRSFCMPACLPRRNEAIVPGRVGGWLGLSAMGCRCRGVGAVARCSSGVHGIGDGCSSVSHPILCLVGKGGLCI